MCTGIQPVLSYLVINDFGEYSGRDLNFILGYTFLAHFFFVFETLNSRVGFAITQFMTDSIN